MSERDELADLIRANRKPWVTNIEHKEMEAAQADAILAAGYRRPRTITTVEELKALEDPDTILVDYKRNAYQWGIGLDGSEGWQSTRDPNPITSNHLWRFTPLTVLHEPEATL